MQQANSMGLNERMKINKILWVALMVSQLVYGYVLVLKKKFSLESFTPDLFQMVLLCCLILAPFIGHIVSKKMREKADTPEKMQSALIVAWAFSESAPIYGLVIGFKYGVAHFYLLGLLVSFIFIMANKPSIELYKKFYPEAAPIYS